MHLSRDGGASTTRGAAGVGGGGGRGGGGRRRGGGRSGGGRGGGVAGEAAGVASADAAGDGVCAMLGSPNPTSAAIASAGARPERYLDSFMSNNSTE